MKTLATLTATLVAGFGFIAGARAEGMTKRQFQAASKTIAAEHQTSKEACASLAGNAKDVCIVQAKAKSNLAEAELLARFEPTAAHRNAVTVARTEGEYAVASERCDDLAGNAKDVCVKEAKAAKVHGLSDAHTRLETQKANAEASEASATANEKAAVTGNEARRDAAEEKRAADYAVAKEKCDVQAGEAKDRCIAEAKATFAQR